ncbi:hypothetical protein [Pseudoalteromonas sp. SR41-7]|uniref:hypothetical protein n=1 Tax=Pseudoalteromonas sp. SR41-7 TaxID=2760947 RepID=UPI0016040BC2|nr:hypothetical protein [Pseudoalteromonas sp. SR41-7]MBB1299229.1 hypothetical protein [Pseudoalteromonas sp. SR41-7]
MEYNANTAANDVRLPLSTSAIHDEISKQLLQGKVVASAPAPGLSTFKWNDEQKSKFVAAISKVKELESM